MKGNGYLIFDFLAHNGEETERERWGRNLESTVNVSNFICFHMLFKMDFLLINKLRRRITCKAQ